MKGNMSSPPARRVSTTTSKSAVSPSAWSARRSQSQQQQHHATAQSRTGRHVQPAAAAASAPNPPKWGRPSQSNPRDDDEDGYEEEYGITDALRARKHRNKHNNGPLTATVPTRIEQQQHDDDDDDDAHSEEEHVEVAGEEGDDDDLPNWCRADQDSDFERLLLEEEAVDAIAVFQDFALQSLMSLHQQSARAVLWGRCLAAKQRDEWLEREARWVILTGLMATRLRVKKRKTFASAVGAVQRGVVVAAQREQEQREAERQVQAVQSGVLASEPRTLALALQVILQAQEARRFIKDEEKEGREKLGREWRASQYAARIFELDRENVVVMAAREKRRKRWEQLDPFLVRRRMPLVANAGMIFVPAPPPAPPQEDGTNTFGGGGSQHRHVVLTRSPNSGTLRPITSNSNKSPTNSSCRGGSNSNRCQGMGTVEANILRQEDERMRLQQAREEAMYADAVAARRSGSGSGGGGTRPGSRTSHRTQSSGRASATGFQPAGGDEIRGYSSADQKWWPNPPPPAAAAVAAAEDDDDQHQQQHHHGGRGSQLSSRSSNKSGGGGGKAPPLPPTASSRPGSAGSRPPSSTAIAAAAAGRPGSRGSSNNSGSSGARHHLPQAAAAGAGGGSAGVTRYDEDVEEL